MQDQEENRLSRDKRSSGTKASLTKAKLPKPIGLRVEIVPKFGRVEVIRVEVRQGGSAI